MFYNFPLEKTTARCCSMMQAREPWVWAACLSSETYFHMFVLFTDKVSIIYSTGVLSSHLQNFTHRQWCCCSKGSYYKHVHTIQHLFHVNSMQSTLSLKIWISQQKESEYFSNQTAELDLEAIFYYETIINFKTHIVNMRCTVDQ